MESGYALASIVVVFYRVSECISRLVQESPLGTIRRCECRENLNDFFEM